MLKIPKFEYAIKVHDWLDGLSDSERMEAVQQREDYCFWVRVNMINNPSEELVDYCQAIQDYKRL